MIQKDNLEINLENTLQAINFLIKPSQLNKEAISQYDEYLQRVEKSIQIWSIAHQILVSNQYSEGVKLFASKFLKNKLMFDFEEVNQEDFQQLLQNLTLYLCEMNDKENKNNLKKSKSQLILCFVYFYMHTYELCGDLLYYFQTCKISQDQHLILDILKYVAEEYYQKKLVIEEKKRENYMKYLRSVQSKVFQSLEQLQKQTEKEDIHQQFKILNTFQSWLHIQRENDNCNDIFTNYVFIQCFSLIDEVELFDLCGDIVISVIEQMEYDSQCTSCLQEYMSKYYKSTHSLLNDELIDEVNNYVDIFNTYSLYLLENIDQNQCQQYYCEMFKDMIALLEHQNLEEIKETLKFFNRFVKHINKQDDTMKQHILQQLSQQIMSLIYCLINRCQFPQLVESAQYLDVQDVNQMVNQYRNIEDNRQLIQSLIIKLEKIVKFNDLFVIFDMKIQQIFQSNSNEQLSQLESVLFIMYNGLTNVHVCEKREQLMELILNIVNKSVSNTRFQETLFELIAQSAKLFDNNSQLLNIIVQYLGTKIDSLQNTKQEETQKTNNKSTCIKALSEIIKYNQQFVQTNLTDFMNLYEKLKYDRNLVNGFIVSLLKLYFSQNISKETFQTNLTKMCQPFAIQIYNVINNQEPKQQIVSQNLDRFAETISEMNCQQKELSDKYNFQYDEHPFKVIYQNFWSVLAKILSIYQNDDNIQEKTIRLIKHSMRYMKSEFAPFLKDLFDILVSNYQQKPNSSYLYIMEVSLTIFDINEHPILNQSFQQFVERSIYEFPNIESFDCNSQLTEDFFGMLFRCVKYQPSFFNSNNSLNLIIRLAIMAIGIQHIEANKSLYLFWEVVIQLIQNPEYNQTKQVVKYEFGQILVVKLIEQIMNIPPTIVHEYICDVIFEIVQNFSKEDPGTLVNYFESKLQNIPQDILVQNEKKLMIQYIGEVNLKETNKYLDLIYKRSIQSQRRMSKKKLQ